MTYSKEEMECLIASLEEMVKSVETLTVQLEKSYHLNTELVKQNIRLAEASQAKPRLRCIK